MPGLNGSGPMGEGAMTGRRMGRCTNFGAGKRNDGNMQQVKNAGSGKNPEEQSPLYGRGRGFGWRRRGNITHIK